MCQISSNFLKSIIAFMFVIFSHAAFASDAKELFDALIAEAEKQGNELKHDRIEEKGGDFIIHGLDFKSPSKNIRVLIAKTELGGFDFLGGAQFTYESLVAEDIEIQIETRLGRPVSVKAERMETNPYVQIQQNGKPAGKLERAELIGISIDLDDDKAEANFNFPKLVMNNIVRSLEAESTTESMVLEAGSGEIRSKGKASTMLFSFDGMTFQNMIEFREGHTEIEHVEFKPLKIVSEDQKKPFEIIFDGARIENYFIPDLSKDTSRLFGDKEFSLEILPLSIIANGGEIMGWVAGYGKGIVSDDGNIQEVFSGITGMFIDIKKFDLKPKQKAQLSQLFALGYEKPVLDFIFNFSWNKNSGLFDLSKYAIDIQDAGSIETSIRLGRYTEQLARELTKAATEINALPEGKERNAKTSGLLLLLAPLTLERYSLSIEDDSLLDKLVQLQSKRSGQDPEQIKAIAAPMVGILLNPIGVPELAKQASFAISQFMNGNQKLSVVAEPDTPLNMLELIQLMQQYQSKVITPAELVDRFNVKVQVQ